jgi:hypothetical protein
MKISLPVATIFLAIASIEVALAETDKRLLLFPTGSSVLCVEEEATGFNWRNKAWTQTNFRPDKKFVVRKLDPETYKDAPTRRASGYGSGGVAFCKDPDIFPTPYDLPKNRKFSGMIEVCYEIKDMGSEASSVSRQSCYEDWDEGRLTQISCNNHNPQAYFHPDGAYIRYPWHTDIDKNADKKDSLTLSVGSCSKIN